MLRADTAGWGTLESSGHGRMKSWYKYETIYTDSRNMMWKRKQETFSCASLESTAITLTPYNDHNGDRTSRNKSETYAERSGD
jgi:hypothetical protein